MLFLAVCALPWGRGERQVQHAMEVGRILLCRNILMICLVLGGRRQVLAQWLVTSQSRPWLLSKAGLLVLREAAGGEGGFPVPDDASIDHINSDCLLVQVVTCAPKACVVPMPLLLEVPS